MQKKGTVPVKTLFVIYLAIFVVLWITLPISSGLDAFAVGIVLTVSFSVAVAVGAFTQRASISVLVCVGLAGLMSVGIGIYFWITVPEGILDPLFIIIGGGVFIVEVLLIINHYWQGRRHQIP